MNVMSQEDFDKGLMQGQINAIEKMFVEQKNQTNKRLDEHDSRFKYIERILWIMVGMWMFIKLIPELKGIVG